MSPDPHEQCTLAVAVSRPEVDAGCPLSLTVHVTGLQADLARPVVVIRDADGAERTRAGLARAADGAHSSGEVLLAAPRAVGAHLWHAIVVACDDTGANAELATADVHFAVVPHTLDLVVWDMPPVVVAGRRIKLQAGIKCSAGCAMGGQAFTVADAEGRLLASTAFTDERWPETEPIYAAEVELSAPNAVGHYDWAITAAATSLDLPHRTATQQMRVTVVPPPDCEVTVEVRDRRSDALLTGASVDLSPYRAATNGAGIATLPVAKGQYDLRVARKGYKPFSTRIKVRTDIFTTAALEPELVAEAGADE